MYFDPGFGSMIIQLIVAATATIGIYFASAKGYIKKWFSKKDKKTEVEDDEL